MKVHAQPAQGKVVLGVRRSDGETWRRCAERHGAPYGLEAEILEEFDRQVANGTPEPQACAGALWDWDCLGFIEVHEDEAGDAPDRP